MTRSEGEEVKGGRGRGESGREAKGRRGGGRERDIPKPGPHLILEEYSSL